MGFVLTKEASERPKRTIDAAEMFHDKAWAIARACHDAREGETIVAVVERDGAFGGVWTVPTGDLCARVPRLESGGWSMVFSPKTTVAEIEERSLRLARLAFARWEAMRRWASRRGS